MSGGQVVIGVDESVGALAALQWATDECQLRDSSLLIVHAPQFPSAVAAHGEAGLRVFDTFGVQLLHELAILTGSWRSGVNVNTLLSHSAAADTLVDLSASAALIVVGTRGSGGNLLSMTGSVSHRVAAHAHCPVAIVPDTATIGSGSSHGAIAVGVANSQAGRASLQFALAEASRRRARVLAVRAYGDDSLTSAELDAADPELRAQAESSLVASLAEYSVEFPDVEVQPLLTRDDPTHAILRAAQQADLVVLGCHHSDDRWSTRLGPVPSSVLHRAGCPVIVVGTAPRPALGGFGR
ncbi:MAG: universal stress protein [Jatrophihabitantaceae bacterium]